MNNKESCLDANRALGSPHTEINSAVEGMDNAIEVAQALLDKINANDTAPPELTSQSEAGTGLRHTLNNAPDEIRGKTDRLVGILNSIESSLYNG